MLTFLTCWSVSVKRSQRNYLYLQSSVSKISCLTGVKPKFKDKNPPLLKQLCLSSWLWIVANLHTSYLPHNGCKTVLHKGFWMDCTDFFRHRRMNFLVKARAGPATLQTLWSSKEWGVCRGGRLNISPWSWLRSLKFSMKPLWIWFSCSQNRLYLD